MSTPIITLLLLLASVSCQVANLSYNILSQGQSLEIPLEEYFQLASSAQIVDEKSSPDYRDKFQIANTSGSPYREVFAQEMEFQYAGEKIRLSNVSYYTTKTVYNQPVKLFLLTNNFLMMLIYSQHCGDGPDPNRVLGLNLTEDLPRDLKGKKILCTSMETQTTELDFAYIACRVDDNIKTYTFFVLEINLVHNEQGFITDMRKTGFSYVVNRTSECTEYGLKFFQVIRIDKTSIPQSIFMYCKQSAIKSKDTNIFYFYTFTTGIYFLNLRSFYDCITNSTYISPIDNGFLSVIGKQVYEYTTNQTEGRSSCQASGIKNVNYLFAASRTYNNIQITYFFLQNNSVIIKSSYRTNYQKLSVNCTGYSFTSYALTEHFMALSLADIYGNTRLLIYEMEELYPRLIDDTVIERNQTIYGNFLLLSTSNYLEKGMYVFFYNNSTNQLSLKEYNGYILTIKPKPAAFLQQTISNNNGPQKSIINVGLTSTKTGQQSPFPQNSTVYTLYIETRGGQRSILPQYMLINIVVRKFDDSGVSFFPAKSLNIDSQFVNFNLSSLAVGPLQRFYIQDNMTDKNVRIQFINYYNTLDISSKLDPTPTSPQQPQCLNPHNCQHPGAIQKIKQIALNVQLKVLNPVFTLYYSTFLQNCILQYQAQKLQFSMVCNPEDIIRFKSSIQFNSSRIIVLSKDKWLQYSNQSMEYCTIVGESGLCELMPLQAVRQEISRIKLVRFQSKTNGNTQIYVFIICDSTLYYGLYRRDNARKFTFTKIFTISQKQVQQLVYMQLTNIHFDKSYYSYLLLHLSTVEGNIIKHMALLYDHPTKNGNGKFLGHLIRKFEDENIESIMTIDNLLIILYRMGETGYTIIREYKISQIYSVFETRLYPLYGRKIIQNGSHVSDGQFLYIEAQQQRKQPGKTEYLVYCPSLGTTNILTHVIPKQSAITFIQQIGGTNNKYPHSIGIHGKNIFALSVPNLVIKFDYDTKSKSTHSTKVSTNVVPYKKKGELEKSFVSGNLQLKLVDYQNIMHEITYKYEFDISAQTIKYQSPQQQPTLQLNFEEPSQSYILNTSKITGPVMQINFNIPKCSFLNKNIQFQDVFTKMQCLIDIDSKKYGTLLDMMTVNFGGNSSAEVIVTTESLICVEGRQVVTRFELPLAQACTIVSYEKNKGLFVCDQGQGSVINLFSFQGKSCKGSNLERRIEKPAWLIYQYFKMKFSDPFVIFQVPIRVESNKIYFLTKFDLETHRFDDKFSSLTFEQYDNFETQDLEVFDRYAYLLEDGLGIYDLKRQSLLNKTNIQPVVWLATKDIQNSLSTSSQLVYIKPKKQLESSSAHQQQQQRAQSQPLHLKCSINASGHAQLEIGTTTHAYQVVVCFNDAGEYEILPIIVYKQYKDCKNNVLSKSKNYGGLTIKLCILEMQEHRIFSNFMPIAPKTSQYYMQFYSINPQTATLQTAYPFRMQKISTNDTFEIKQETGQLIVRSLFNFICYYQLASKIKWTLLRNDNVVPSNQKECNATVSLKNENFITQFTILVKNTDPESNLVFMPWIFRTFYMVLMLVSAYKLRIHIKNKKRKQNKMTYNLISNQFQFKVRLNSKKEIQMDNQSESELHSSKHLSQQ